MHLRTLPYKVPSTGALIAKRGFLIGIAKRARDQHIIPLKTLKLIYAEIKVHCEELLLAVIQFN